MATATRFDGYSHQKLREMIASLDPVAVKDRADQLAKASEDIKKIGEKLKNHRVSGWEGQAATDFQEWVGRAGNATLRLSEYSATGSKWMADAVQTMTEATKMPVYDTAAAKNLEAAKQAHNDPDAPMVAKQEEKKLEDDHLEAVRLMNNLAQKYEQSSTHMNAAEIPTFPPPPQAFVPSDHFGAADMARPGGESGGAGSAGSSYVSSAPGGGSSNEPGWVPGHQAQPDNTPPRTTGPAPLPLPGIPDPDVDVDLDHVATLPPPTTTLPPTTGTPLPQVPVGPGGPSPVVPIPPVTLPPISGPMLPNIGPGGQGPLQGLGKVGQVPGLPPRDSGILGGRQVPTSGPNAGLPRGTVIGTEGTQAGRAMGGTQAGRAMGGMTGGGMGGGAHGGVGGSPVGRRLASEPGGIVGGRQSVVGGVPAKGGQPFTQGGSGLVRNTAAGTGAGAHTPSRQREDRGGDRPDYLAEDEETWQGNRRVVPPVVD
ncbi:WXG100 family type VII secretion target [Streptomyces sp. NPDC048337]|uniref:WXG100 family type VII secretion target n=1 Tax=Streptomyces sp. NPDC048337 TaxID=3365535 RepID=UPI0037111EBE